VEQLTAAGCQKVYREKVSGAKSDRRELLKLMKRLEAGDAIIITRLDRLARSTRDLLNIVHQLSELGVGFKSLKDTWIDTTTAHGRLVLTILGGLAEFERELILSRTSEGRKRALEKGVRFGRKSTLTRHQQTEAVQRVRDGESQSDVARTFNVDQSTISRIVARNMEFVQ
jgi:DNA invertase Pin-like site-specific DNA recombinase